MTKAVILIENIIKNLYLRYDKEINDKNEQNKDVPKGLSTKVINIVTKGYQYVRDTLDPSTKKILDILLTEIIPESKACQTYDDWINFIILCGNKAYELENIKSTKKHIEQSRSCEIVHMIRSFVLMKQFKGDSGFYAALEARKTFYKDKIIKLKQKIDTIVKSEGPEKAPILQNECNNLVLSLAYLCNKREESNHIFDAIILQPDLLTIAQREQDLNEPSACRRFKNENVAIPYLFQNFVDPIAGDLCVIDSLYQDKYWKLTNLHIVLFLQLDGVIVTKNTNIESQFAHTVPTVVPIVPIVEPIPNPGQATPAHPVTVIQSQLPAAKPKAAAKHELPFINNPPPPPAAATPKVTIDTQIVAEAKPESEVMMVEFDDGAIDINELFSAAPDYQISGPSVLKK